MLTKDALLKNYTRTIEVALHQLDKSKSTTGQFQGLLVYLIAELKRSAIKATKLLQTATKENIDTLKKIPNLQAEIALLTINDHRSDDENQRLKDLEHELKLAESVRTFEGAYFSKTNKLTKYIKRTTVIMDNLLSSFEYDKNEVLVMYMDIRERLLKLQQHIQKQLVKPATTDILHMNNIIISAQAKLDTLNLKINKYNVLIDKFNNMGESLQIKILSYINPRKRLQLHYINIAEYNATLTELSNYSGYSELDLINQAISEFFTNKMQLPVDIIKIEAPDLTFREQYVYTDDDMDTGDFTYEGPTSDATDGGGGGTLPPNINENAKIIITGADWASPTLNINMMVRYGELCARLGFNIRINAPKTTNINYTVDLKLYPNTNVLIYHYKNRLTRFKSKDVDLGVFLYDDYDTYEYEYENGFTLSELMCSLYFIMVKGLNPTYYVPQTPEIVVKAWRESIVANALLPNFVTRLATPRTDITYKVISERPSTSSYTKRQRTT